MIEEHGWSTSAVDQEPVKLCGELSWQITGVCNH